MIDLNPARRMPASGAFAVLLLIALAARSPAADAPAAGDAQEEIWSFHAQFTNVTQYHPSFTSSERGPNSLDPGNRGDETIDLTLFLGVRPWRGGEAYADAEVDQGFGLSDTLGVAAFPSGEAYKVGEADPYVRLPRAFFRQTIDLGGEAGPVEPDANQLAGTRTADNIVITIGKFGVVDLFDTNIYAHDPRADFLNWAIIDAGAFDYAADSWAYTYGGAAEWTQSWWTLRGGVFDLSREPNSKRLERGFGQYSVNAEVEERHEILGRPGKLKLLAFDDRGHMANYLDAVRAAAGTGLAPTVATVRRYSGKPGISLNLEQEIADGLGLFARASIDDGRKEAFEFTEINRSVSGGLSLNGGRWNRPDDTVGLAGVIDGLSNPALAYFRAGGLGLLIGDGQLKTYGLEKVIETYYSASVIDGIAVSLDWQYIENPAYNADRGPVSVFGFRFHGQF
jgi:high affinity Mn2+ porin